MGGSTGVSAGLGASVGGSNGVNAGAGANIGGRAASTPGLRPMLVERAASTQGLASMSAAQAVSGWAWALETEQISQQSVEPEHPLEHQHSGCIGSDVELADNAHEEAMRRRPQQ